MTATERQTLSDLQPVWLRGADGVKIAGDLCGPEDGPFVLMTHGGGQTRHSWGRTASKLGGRGYRVLSIDQRGHGDSGWSADGRYSVEAYAADVKTIVGSFSPAPVAFVGASMGGLASLTASAALPPEKVGALVLVDVATRVRPEGSERILGFMRRHAGGFDTLDQAADAIAEYRPNRPRPTDLSGLSKNLRERPEGGWRWHWDPAMLQRPMPNGEVIPVAMLEQAARALRAPALLIRGLQSDVVDDASVATLKALIPQLEVADVRDAGHMVVGDNNEVFDARVSEFLDGVARSGHWRGA